MSSLIRFGDYFRQRRKTLGLSLREFSRRNGFDPGNISKLERNILTPPRSADLLDSYAKALKLHPESAERETLFELALKEGAARLPRSIRARRISTRIRAVILEQWADRYDAQYTLPLLVRQLVRGTVTSSHLVRAQFPALEGAQRPGWDGLVEATHSTEFVPAGLSVWEMSVNKQVRKKAEQDFKKRTKASLGPDKKQSTFIFVTLRKWQGKDVWCEEKKSLNCWKDVRVYDSESLEEWLGTAKGVDSWLARRLGYRPEAVIDLEGYWENLSASVTPTLQPEVFLASRTQDIKEFAEWLKSPPSVLAFEASSPRDVIDFVAAFHAHINRPECTWELKVDPHEITAKTLIIGDKQAWAEMSSCSIPLLLIPEPALVPDMELTAEAVRQGHHVLLCSHRFSTQRDRVRYLSRPEPYELKRALIKSGLEEQEASKRARQSGGSLTVLKRAISRFPAVKQPEWSQPAAAPELIPFLLVGAWDDASDADQRVIEKLSGKSYEENVNVINSWLNEPDTPVLRVLTKCSLVSREDSWQLLAGSITQQKLTRFEDITVEILSEVDPRYELPTQEQPYAAFHDNALKYSVQLRSGVCETLALLACKSGDNLAQNGINPERIAERITRKLLNEDTSWQLWASLSDLLPVLAETAPEVFLSAVEKDLKRDAPALKELFDDMEVPVLFFSCAFQGLSDALEILAWNPSYLTRVGLILARLYDIDPQKGWSNRSLRSLQRVFLPWRSQTTASVEERIKVIDKIVQRHSKPAWDLLLSLMPDVLKASTDTRMPMWRDWPSVRGGATTPTEYWQQVTAYANRLAALVGTDVERWLQLINKFGYIPENVQQQLLDQLEQFDLPEVDAENRIKMADGIRKQLKKRRVPDRPIMPPAIVGRLEAIQTRFEPDDPVARHLWLFTALYPPGYINLAGSWEQRQEAIDQKRVKALREIYEHGGLEGVIRLATASEYPGIAGSVYVKSALNNDNDEIIPTLLSSENQPEKEFAAGVVRALFEQKGWDWVESFHLKKWLPAQSGLFLSVLPFGRKTWALVEKEGSLAEAVYWGHVSVSFHEGSKEDIEYAAVKLLRYGHPLKTVDVLNMALHNGCNIDPDLVMETLETLETEAQNLISPEGISFSDDDKYDIQQLFTYLQECRDTDRNRLAKLEWVYLGLLDKHLGSSPATLQKFLQQDPGLFCDLIKMVFRSDQESEDDGQTLTEKEKIRIDNAYLLLTQWEKIPGMNDDAVINERELMAWVETARKKCAESGHLAVCDECIGGVLATEPEVSAEWPSIPVRDIIDEIDSDDLARGFRVGIYNKNGSAPVERGKLAERQLAEKYHRFAKQAELEWPKTAASLRRLAQDYEREAKREEQLSNHWVP